VLVDGVPDDWPSLQGLVPFGAEGRLAEVTEIAGPGQLAPSERTLKLVASTGRVVLVALTPLWLSGEAWAGQAPVPGLGGARVVCGVTDRPQRAGGWDSRRGEPVAQHSVLPAGTTVYLEHERGEELRDTVARLGVVEGVVQVGEGREMGFGAVLAGPWPGQPA
ncbi:MAG: type III-B CRISPR module-associated Cmr3 family protein, partial [Acidimicrobiales bacterium]